MADLSPIHSNFLLTLPATYANYRKKRRPELELITLATSGIEDARLSGQLLDWFSRLSPAEREEVCADENPWLVIMFNQMMQYKAKKGESVYAVDRNAEREIFNCELRDNFFSKKRTDTEASCKLRAEWIFEEHIRVWSIGDDWNTLAISSQLASDPDLLLDLMSDISNGQSFAVPCRVTWFPSIKMWIRESPPWLSPSSNSLAEFAAASLERTIWFKFWAANEINPRRPGENQTFLHDSPPRDGYPRAKESYVDFWRELDRAKRMEIIGSPSALAAEYISGLESFERLRQASSATQEDEFVLELDDSSKVPSADECLLHQRILLGRMKDFEKLKSVDAILQQGSSPDSSVGDFIDMLFTASLDRISSVFDMVARRVGEELITAYQAKMAEDLALLEEAEQAKKQGKKNREDKVKVLKVKKKKKKRRLSDASAVSVSTSASAAISLSSKDEDDTSDSRSIAGKLQEAETLPLSDTSNSKQQIPELPDEDCIDEKEECGTSEWPMQPIPSKKKKKKKKAKRQSQALAIAPQPAQMLVPQSYPDRLTKDIVKYRAEVERLTEKQRTAREEVIAKISKVCARMFLGCTLELFGSMSTGLALPWSDVDLAIAGTGFSTRDEISSAICVLGLELAAESWVSEHQIIPTATTPIIKLDCLSASQTIKADITFEDERRTGSRSSLFCLDSISQFPVLRDLALVLKSMLRETGLNTAFQGGLSSYQLVLWVIAFLKIREPASAGQLLLDFLRYYGVEFDPKTTGICVYDPPIFYRLENAFAPVVTLDPISRDCNVTRCCTLITQILKTFAKSHSLLMEMQTQKKKGFVKTLLTTLAKRELSASVNQF